MSPLVHFFDRVVSFLVGIALITIGAWSVGLYHNVPIAQQLADEAQFRDWLTIPDRPWFVAAISIAAFLVVLGVLAGIYLNLRSYRIRRVPTPATTSDGSIDIDLASMANAAASTFREVPRVAKTQANVTEIRGHRLVSITVLADPQVSLSALNTQAEMVESDLRAALGGLETEIRFMFHVSAINRQPVT